MADRRITEHTALAEQPATGDWIEIVDVSDTTDAATGTNKRINRANLLGTVLAATTASFTTADESKLDGIEAGATADQTAAEILAALLTVDGAGSGLDADLLDGNSSAAFATSGHDHSGVYQPADTDLTAIAALTSAADKVPYSTGAGTWALADLTAAGRALLDDANAAAQRVTLGIPVTLSFILSDETTALTTGTKLTYEIPFALTLTEVPKASLTTAGTGTTVDIKEAGTTILTNKIVFDSGETSISTAATPPTLADSSIAANAVLTFIVDATAGAAAGLKVSLTGTRT